MDAGADGADLHPLQLLQGGNGMGAGENPVLAGAQIDQFQPLLPVEGINLVIKRPVVYPIRLNVLLKAGRNIQNRCLRHQPRVDGRAGAHHGKGAVLHRLQHIRPLTQHIIPVQKDFHISVGALIHPLHPLWERLLISAGISDSQAVRSLSRGALRCAAGRTGNLRSRSRSNVRLPTAALACFT